MFFHFENNILFILKNIYGCSIIELVNYINYNISLEDRLNKGFIGNLIENYINFFNNNNNNVCDINFINLEIKTFLIDFNLKLKNDISLMSVNNFVLLNSFIINRFLYKIKNVLFVLILSSFNNILENNIIINSFILKFNKKDFLKFFYELKYFNKFMILNKSNNLYNNNFYTNSFKFQLINKDNGIKKLIIFFRKKFIYKIINCFKLLN